MQVRRVVTGHSDSGKACVVSDSLIDPRTAAAFAGYEFHTLWGSDDTSHFPDDGHEPPWIQYFPPVGGFRFGIFTVPPKQQQAQSGHPSGTFQEVESVLPGLLKYSEPNGSGMHKTPTIDFEVVLTGEITLELDDGVRVILRPGDTVIQNGTRHRWLNTTDEPASYAVFLIGARHDSLG